MIGRVFWRYFCLPFCTADTNSRLDRETRPLDAANPVSLQVAQRCRSAAFMHFWTSSPQIAARHTAGLDTVGVTAHAGCLLLQDNWIREVCWALHANRFHRRSSAKGECSPIDQLALLSPIAYHLNPRYPIVAVAAFRIFGCIAGTKQCHIVAIFRHSWV